MKDTNVVDVRNFMLAGHSGSGKTTLVDTLLFTLGVNDRQGSVANGSSMADYLDEEKKHKTTISAKSFTLTPSKLASGRKLQMTILDTPGFADFAGQAIQAARVAGAMVVVVDAHAGLQVGTLRSWALAEKMALPVAVLITGLDRENTSFEKALSAVQKAWGNACVPMVLPLANLSGVADILSANVPAEVADAAASARDKLMEIAAETEDELTEKFLKDGTLSEDEIARGARTAMAKRALMPIFAIAAPKGLGLTEFMEGVARWFPSPLDRPMKDVDGKAIDPSPNAPFVGFVWKTVNDPFVGPVAFVYVAGGTLNAELDVTNAAKGQKEHIVSLLNLAGKKSAVVDKATAGDIVALAKLKATALGEALCQTGTQVTFAPFVFPNPVAWSAVTAKTQGDDDKIGTALHRVAEEDPTIHVERNADTHEMVLAAMGDLHIAVAVERMHSRNHVEVTLSTPKVPYKETVTARGEGHYKHKKQTGGRGQYGEVYMFIEPKAPSEVEWFASKTVGGSIPGNFLPAIHKGFAMAMERGCVAGFPVVNVKAVVYDGSFHDVDSSEIAFKIAGSRAFRDGMSKARPVLLEPIMTVRISVPDHFMGDVSGDLSHKRGRIVSMETDEGMQVIVAEIPQSDIFHYCAELRSMTGGRASFEATFARYDVVPSNVAQKIIASAVHVKDSDEE